MSEMTHASAFAKYADGSKDSPPADTLAELRSALAGLETRPTQALIKLLLLMQLPNLTEGFQKA
jgi:hypothetical protein